MTTRPKKENAQTTQTIQLTQAELLPTLDKPLTPYEALVGAIQHCQNVSASRINPHFRSRYFALGDLLAEIKPVFGHFGLCIIQIPNTGEKRISIQTQVIHTSGHIFQFGELGINTEGNIQQTGSALSYLRRYALATIVGVASDLEGGDDDGNLAAKPVPARPVQASQQTPAKSGGVIIKGQWHPFTSPDEQAAAKAVLVRKGWLTEAQTLDDLPDDRKAELSSPQMAGAFRQAVKQQLSAPQV